MSTWRAATAFAVVSWAGCATDRGVCSGTSVLQIEARLLDGVIEVEADLETQQQGQVWTVTFIVGDERWSTDVETRGEDGDAWIERSFGAANAEEIVVQAVEKVSGEVCQASISRGPQPPGAR